MARLTEWRNPISHQTTVVVLDAIAALGGFLSGLFWLLSASVKWPFNLAPDENHKLAEAAAKSGRWNALAAISAMISIIIPIVVRHL